MYNCEIIADSKNQFGDRITTFVVTYPRIIHAEMCRHRMFSRNTASSRAIPTKKMFQYVEEDPFIPIAWQKNHKGMQGKEYVTDGEEIEKREYHWLKARDHALEQARTLAEMGTTKQLINRLLEPFQWSTEIITATELENFFQLRCPQYHTPVSGEGYYFRSKADCIANHSNPDNLEKMAYMSDLDWLQINESPAEIHIQKIAEMMWDAYNESKPKQLNPGEWHVPFGDNLDFDTIDELSKEQGSSQEIEIKIATARCARVSYINYEGGDDYKKDLDLHDRLYQDNHASPFEHCARAMSRKEREQLYTIVKDFPDDGWCRNFKGFIQYRDVCGI